MSTVRNQATVPGMMLSRGGLSTARKSDTVQRLRSRLVSRTRGLLRPTPDGVPERTATSSGSGTNRPVGVVIGWMGHGGRVGWWGRGWPVRIPLDLSDPIVYAAVGIRPALRQPPPSPRCITVPTSGLLPHVRVPSGWQRASHARHRRAKEVTATIDVPPLLYSHAAGALGEEDRSILAADTPCPPCGVLVRAGAGGMAGNWPLPCRPAALPRLSSPAAGSAFPTRRHRTQSPPG